MVNIYCSKTFSNLFNVDLLEKEDSKILRKINDWSAHSFKKGKEQNLIFVNHSSLFYFVIFNIKKSDFQNIEELFLKNLIDEISKKHKLNEFETEILKENFLNLIFYDKSTINEINSLIKNFVSVIKNFESFDGITFKSFYSEEDFLNDDTTELFLNELFNKPNP